MGSRSFGTLSAGQRQGIGRGSSGLKFARDEELSNFAWTLRSCFCVYSQTPTRGRKVKRAQALAVSKIDSEESNETR